MERQKQILLQIDSLSSGGAAAQSTSGDQSGVAASTTPTADAGTANAGAPVKSGDANTDYNAAIALVQDKSRQDDAMVAFQNFIKNYPDSTYLPNANYWLGQLNYNKGKKDDAAYYFASVVKTIRSHRRLQMRCLKSASSCRTKVTPQKRKPYTSRLSVNTLVLMALNRRKNV